MAKEDCTASCPEDGSKCTKKGLHVVHVFDCGHTRRD